MNSILKLKHWQMFLILCSTYIIGIVFELNIFSIGRVLALQISVYSAIISLILFFSWIMVIGIYLNKIPDNPYHFRTPVLILAVLCSMIGYIELNIERLEQEGLFAQNFFSMLLPLFAPFGIFYTFYNVPKSLKSIELGRKAMFSEWIIDALLLFTFPIGVWFIQPRLNKIFSMNELIKNEEINSLGTT